MEKISEEFMWKTSFQPPSAPTRGALKEVSTKGHASSSAQNIPVFDLCMIARHLRRGLILGNGAYVCIQTSVRRNFREARCLNLELLSRIDTLKVWAADEPLIY
jgi:hypothetical protein